MNIDATNRFSAKGSGSWGISSSPATTWKGNADAGQPAREQGSATPPPPLLRDRQEKDEEEDLEEDGVDDITFDLSSLSTANAANGEATGSSPTIVRKSHEGLVKNQNDVIVTLADQQADPNSPLYSVTSFEDLGLSPELLRGVYHMKFTRPSKIQERALPLLLKNPPTNMIGQSQSGTGKTAAFALTMLSRVNPSINAPQALCIAPARELARQIMDVVREMGQFTKVTTCFAIKESIQRGQKIDQQIIVGTPGTVLDVLKRKQLPTKDFRLFVLDEADSMLGQQGMVAETVRIKSFMPRTCQLVLFSATYPEQVSEFAQKFAPNSNEIRLKHEELTVDGIKQFYMDCESVEHKIVMLTSIYSLMTIGQSIIFCRMRRTADEIGLRMKAEGHAVIVLHGALETSERDQTMDDFRSGKCKVLITTNVIARGIDVSQVNLVVNFDMPLDAAGRPDPEIYLHRIGRTGRFGRSGVSINFLHDQKSWEEMSAIQDHFGKTIDRLPANELDTLEEVLKKALK